MNDSKQHGYERSDAAPKPLVLFGIALAIVIAGSVFTVKFAVSYWGDRVHQERALHPLAPLRMGPSGPLLQAQTRAELSEHRSVEKQRLGGHGWIDEDNGIVHIPVRQAMQIFVERQAQERDQ